MTELFESCTEEQMQEMEEREKAWQRYWNALMGQCYAEQSAQEELVQMAIKKATK